VLQHIREPQRAIAELVRVLKPGGLLLAYDNDWATFTIASEMAEMARVVEQRWRGSFANGSIGRELPELFRVAGLLEVAVHPGTCVLAEFESADKVYNLRATMQKTVEERLISAPQGCAWLEEQVGRSAKGCFSASLTAYAVIGRKY
jgi:SAM-dependent methyltransferase